MLTVNNRKSKCSHVVSHNAESDTEAEADAKKYPTFWKEFGKTIKLGIIEDTQNRVRLAKLLRFQTSKSGTKEIGLDTYTENMKEGQKSIYYLAGMQLVLPMRLSTWQPYGITMGSRCQCVCCVTVCHLKHSACSVDEHQETVAPELLTESRFHIS